MALDVIGAGLGRTGTLTLKSALERLGFGPCHHMIEVVENPGQMGFWNRAADGQPVDWEEMYGAYRATVDWPGCHFYAELAERYPDAKVILSRRDPEDWYRSMRRTILQLLEENGLVENIPADHPMRFAGIMIAQHTLRGDFSKEKAIAAFERHNEEVQRHIASDRLLVFDVGDGWEPLCNFLGVPVPDEPFPRSNDAGEFSARAQKVREFAPGESGRS